MNWTLLQIVPAIFLVAVFLLLLWGARQMWKTNNKFLSFIFFLIAAGAGIAIYALYGHYFF